MKQANAEESLRKEVKFDYSVKQKHWVGDGFFVHAMLRPSEELNRHISPFILMDYAAPETFTATSHRRGVGEHPHRGFETVTFAYQGEVEHRDSSGGGGVIKSGDVQWMTAGSGIIHEEFHSETFSSKGGIFEMVQLWVNLPKKHKMTPPKYQAITDQDIPRINLGETAELRVIAGEFEGAKGPSETFTPINVWDITSKTGQPFSLRFATGTNTVLLILRGSLKMGQKPYEEQSILIFERDGDVVEFESSDNFKALILNGEPIDEPIFAHGPFVMTTKQEIIEAIEDYQNGKMGRLS